MKYYITVIISLAMILSSCGNNNSKLEEAEEALDQIEVSDDFEEAKDCEEFIDQYEEWVDNYLVLLERYTKNPMDAALSQEYMKVAQEAANWSSQWSGNLVHCASKEKYQKRFEAISDKVDKKMEELGME